MLHHMRFRTVFLPDVDQSSVAAEASHHQGLSRPLHHHPVASRQGKILAVGYKDGKEVMRDSLINHGPVADVRLDADYTTLAVSKGDYTIIPEISNAMQKNIGIKNRNGVLPTSTVSHIRLTLVDKDGLIQQMQPKKFRVEVEGPIRLLGVETGDMRRMESWRTTELPTYFGEGLIRLQSTTKPGTARVKVYVAGFVQPFIKEFVIK